MSDDTDDFDHVTDEGLEKLETQMRERIERANSQDVIRSINNRLDVLAEQIRRLKERDSD